MRGLILAAAVLAAIPAPTPTHAAESGGMGLADFQAAARERLMRADTDDDDRLSAGEWSQAGAALQARRDPARLFKFLDRDRDGYLTELEIDQLSARRFSRIDANGDGKVTAEERAAARKRSAG